MSQKQAVSLNKYFYVPFFIWMVSGAVLMYFFPEQFLFCFVNNNFNRFLDGVMPLITQFGEAVVIIPILLLPFLLKTFRSLWYFFTALCCNFIPFLIQQGFKFGLDYPRPMHHFEDADWQIHLLPNWPKLMQHSFPSGHCVGAFSLMCFLSLLLPARFQKFGFLFFILALLVCYSRIYLAAHYFEDAYYGSIIGCYCTTVIYFIMHRFKRNLITPN